MDGLCIRRVSVYECHEGKYTHMK